MTTDPFSNDDPFLGGGSGTPVFMFHEIGAEITGVVTQIEKRADTQPDGTAKLWSDGSPMMVFIFHLDTNTGPQRVFVRGNMVTAIREASNGQSTIGKRLTLQHHKLGDKKPGKNPAKLFRAKIEQPAPTAPNSNDELW